MTSQIAYLSQSYVYIVYFYNDSIYNIIVLIIKSYAHTVFPIMVHFATCSKTYPLLDNKFSCAIKSVNG